jgi:hypothetical protein
MLRDTSRRAASLLARPLQRAASALATNANTPEGASTFYTRITAGQHQLVADEPTAVNGTNLVRSPRAPQVAACDWDARSKCLLNSALLSQRRCAIKLSAVTKGLSSHVAFCCSTFFPPTRARRPGPQPVRAAAELSWRMHRHDPPRAYEHAELGAGVYTFNAWGRAVLSQQLFCPRLLDCDLRDPSCLSACLVSLLLHRPTRCTLTERS